METLVRALKFWELPEPDRIVTGEMDNEVVAYWFRGRCYGALTTSDEDERPAILLHVPRGESESWEKTNNVMDCDAAAVAKLKAFLDEFKKD